jgi:hypothetical protein
MNKQEFTIAKFQICSEIDQSTLENWVISAESVPNKLKVNILEFKKILIKYDMEEYTSLLICYLKEKKVDILFKQQFQPKFSNMLQFEDESIEYTKELAEMLHFLLDNKSGSITAIKINKQRDVKEITNKKIITSIIKAIQQKINRDFRKDSGHIDFLTFEEAKEEIKLQKEPEWVTEWNKKHIYVDGAGKRIYVDENMDTVEYLDPATRESVSGEAILNLMIEDYAFDHETEREVTLDYLEKVKTRDPKQKGKRGAPEKYSSIKPIMQVLADLRRTEKLYKNLDKGLNTNNFTLKNSDYRFINDCLVCWSLKQDPEGSGQNTTTIEKALRAIYKPSGESFLVDRYPKLIALKSAL